LHPIKSASEFPDLIACYQLILTLPVASASAERSFPTMRRIKTHLRASMGDGPLSNLSLIAVEHEKIDKLLENRDPRETAGKRIWTLPLYALSPERFYSHKVPVHLTSCRICI
jgi:hAT family C-terminal dimerisation region